MTSPWKNAFIPVSSAKTVTSLAVYLNHTCRDGHIKPMRAMLATLLTLLYPHRCLGCKMTGETGDGFCAACHTLIHLLVEPLCVQCGAPFTTTRGPSHVCGRCLAHPPAFRRARSWASYQTGEATPHPLNEAIQQFKYQRSLSTGKALATLGAAHFPWEQQEYDVIVPVPLHVQRLRWRGFNQSLILAQAIGRAHDLPVNPFLLERTRPTVPQTELSQKERRDNVRGAFAVATPEQIVGKRVLVVDDVYTSGATVDECCRALQRGGAEIVDVFTLARAVRQ